MLQKLFDISKKYDFEIKTVNSDIDHLHMLVSIKPTPPIVCIRPYQIAFYNLVYTFFVNTIITRKGDLQSPWQTTSIRYPIYTLVHSR